MCTHELVGTENMYHKQVLDHKYRVTKILNSCL